MFLGKSNADTITAAGNSISGKAGDMPKNVANGYRIAIVDGYVDRTQLGDTINTLADLQKIGSVYTESFNIVEATSTFSEVTVASSDDEDETSFAYAGDETGFNVSFYIDGEKAVFGDEGNNAVVVWDEFAGSTAPAPDASEHTDFAIKAAGTYSGTVYGQDGLKGEAKFSFEVAPIDLSKAVLTYADQKAGENSNPNAAVGTILMNGDNIASDAQADVSVTPYKATLADGTVKNTWASQDTAGSYVYKVTPADPEDTDVIGVGYITANVYANLVSDVKYGITSLSDGDNFGTFYASLGQSFNPSYITVAGKTDGFSYTVKNGEGEEFAGDWANLPADDYILTVTADAAADYSTGGSITANFTVKASNVDYSDATAFVSVDGKVKASGSDIEYTGSAVVPTVVAKDADNNLLKEGTDYTVELQDAEGNAVEGFTDVADGYKVVVEFADGSKIDDFTLDIVPAVIRSVQPAADFFVTDGETAAQPTFEFSTNADFEKGQKVELSADQISVSYFEVDGDGTEADPYTKDATKKVDAKDLVDQKVYWAEVTVLSTVENYKTESATLPGTAFEVRIDGGFVDVDASEWYAGVVKQAKDLSYMTGIAGTKLFMPEAQITRAEVAQVFFNMAGQSSETGTFPTKFSDVEADAWYAQAIAWASQAGVVGGYDDGVTFGTFDNATREQVATMIYRYAKAQGLDVTVSDEAAALAKYADGSSVSDWAKTAMAYCVEQGVMGVDTDFLSPLANMSRAEMAATAVRVQPEKLA